MILPNVVTRGDSVAPWIGLAKCTNNATWAPLFRDKARCDKMERRIEWNLKMPKRFTTNQIFSHSTILIGFSVAHFLKSVAYFRVFCIFWATKLWFAKEIKKKNEAYAQSHYIDDDDVDDDDDLWLKNYFT